jgi:thioesterase domain-containing protein
LPPREVSGEIQRFRQGQPGAPVHLIGLSAGTAVLVYALKELPPDVKV